METAWTELAAVFGAVYLGLDAKRPEDTDPATLRPRLIAALTADNRVTRVVPGTGPASHSSAYSYFPYHRDADQTFESVVVSQDRPETASIQPFAFFVSVPVKNQPLFGIGGIDPPTDYVACSDGTHFITAWHQGPKERPAFNAGLIVRDIIEAAWKTQGWSPEIQGPSPAHTTLKIRHDPDVSRLTLLRSDPETRMVECRVPEKHDLVVQLVELYYNVSVALEYFYRLENLRGRAILLQSLIRQDLGELQMLQYEHARTQENRHPRAYISATWRQRGWRRRARSLVAREWLSITALGQVNADRTQRRNRLEDFIQDRGLVPLLAVDLATYDGEPSRVDMAAVSHGLEATTSGLDNRAIAVMTLVAGLVGALAAIIVVLLSHALGIGSGTPSP
jgi:hypothetical protein